MSGCIWAFLAGLCDGFTSPETLFYLAAICGITAGAVTHGTAYARIPLCFITPPLVTTAACLVRGGEFDRVCLAGCILIYLVALARGALQSEAMFREASRLKNEATALACSLASANHRATEVAGQMSVRAMRDSLTGLLNRAGFFEEVELQIEGAKGPSCLMLLDLDGFKSINDAFGHTMGDRVLREVAGRIETTSPLNSRVARLGGDEFSVFYQPSANDLSPEQLADELKAAVVAPFESFSAGRLGISVGIHLASATSVADMLICADEALYAAKASGRNRSCLFDGELRRRLEMRRDTERDLPDALAEGHLEVWFQPIFNGGGRIFSGFEALLRWKHPKHGWIAPPDVIAAAATAGASENLLRFIVHEACTMASTLTASGRERGQISINVSPRELARLPVDEIVLSAIINREIDPGSIEIEITEEAALDLGGTREKLSALSSAGVRLAVDDFGVGFSSLATLRQLRPSRVKIDRTFITGIAGSPDDQVVVQAVVGLGRSMDFEVVAEGVETSADVLALRASGVLLMQGYALGRPMPAGSALGWIEGGCQAAA